MHRRFSKRTYLPAACLALGAIGFGLIVAAAADASSTQDRQVRQDQNAPPAAAQQVEITRLTDVVYATIPTAARAKETTDQHAEDQADAAANDIELKFDAAYPTVKEKDTLLPAVVYIHGGGWAYGDKRDGAFIGEALARGGYFAATIQYRLSDVATYPAAVHDCKAAIRYLRANAKKYGIDPQRIGVCGHSAGGHLAAYLTMSGNAEQTHGDVGHADGDCSVACGVSISGVLDFYAITPIRQGQILREWLGDMTGKSWESRLREASPINWVDKDDPPLMLIHGTADELVPHSQSKLMHDAIEAVGGETKLLMVDDAGHMIRQWEPYVEAMRFFDKHLGGKAADAAARRSL